jgi:tetratricopeptide (TPR) repeat protein
MGLWAPEPEACSIKCRIRMSSIHDALKKAQEQREGHYRKYSGVVLTREKQRRSAPVRVIFWVSVLFVVILLGIASYSRIHLGGAPRKAKTGSLLRRPVAPVQPALPVPQKDAKDLFERGMAFHKSGRLKEAKRLYEEALRVDPGGADALNNLGVIGIHERDFGAAQGSFEKAIKLKPGYVDPYYNLACLYALKGELSQGLVHLKKAVSLDQSVKEWARGDTDLRNLWGVPGFQELVRERDPAGFPIQK